MNIVKNPQAKWYMELMDKFNHLMERMGVPESISNEFKVLLIDVARDQYMAGNRSGISWIKKQMAGERA